MGDWLHRGHPPHPNSGKVLLTHLFGLPEGRGTRVWTLERAIARVAKRHWEVSRGCDPEQIERARYCKHPRTEIRK